MRKLLEWLGVLAPPNETEEMVQVDIRTGLQTPVAETPAGKLWAEILTGYCPDCGHKGFYEGPHGGMSINIECAGCGARFNVTPAIGIADRI